VLPSLVVAILKTGPRTIDTVRSFINPPKFAHQSETLTTEFAINKYIGQQQQLALTRSFTFIGLREFWYVSSYSQWGAFYSLKKMIYMRTLPDL
jgi:hypothetical protein